MWDGQWQVSVSVDIPGMRDICTMGGRVRPPWPRCTHRCPPSVSLKQSLHNQFSSLEITSDRQNQIWLHDSRALIQLLLCDRPINFNQRLPLPFWQLTQATKLTPVTSNFMAIKFSSILDKDKWTFVSRIVFQNIFHWASVYIMEGRIYGQFVCF